MNKFNKLSSWQQKDWQILQGLLSKSPKVILLHHLEGIGEERMMFQVAKYLLCLQQKQQWTSECECASCFYCKVGLSEHPDLSLVKLNKKNKGGIDRIRKILDNELLSPHLSRRRITAIQQAHYLTHSAQNGLLKSLESDHGGYYILTTTQIDGLLPTLRSRAMRHQLSAPKKEEFISFLSVRAESKQLHLLWKLTGGRAELAENWLNNNYLEQYELIIKLMAQLLLKKQMSNCDGRGMYKNRSRFYGNDIVTMVGRCNYLAGNETRRAT